MAYAGYSVLLRKSGTTAAVTTEPVSIVANGASTTFRITAAAKRVIDPQVDFHFKNGTATIAYSTIVAIDFLNGEVTFSGAQAAGSVTSLSFSGSYLPITTSSDVILNSRNYKLSTSVDLLDTTVFTGSTVQFTHSRIPALKDFSLSVESISTASELSTLIDAQVNGTPMVTEVFYGDAAVARFRGFCLVESIDFDEAVDGLQTVGLNFKAAAISNDTAGQAAGFTVKIQP